MRLHHLACAAALCAAAPRTHAQCGGNSTPGMPAQAATGHGSLGDPRSSHGFNPDLGVILDIVGDHLDFSGGSEDDGFDATLRSGELTASAWVDPSAFAYASIVFADDEVALEEGVLRYEGFDSNLTLTGGRFFVDFGKQMQSHVHALRTVERPAVLRAYLGEELAGDGLQVDGWFRAGDAATLRYSFAALGSLVSETENAFDDDRKQLDELAFTGRITGFADVGQRGTLQLGASVRGLPHFGLEAPGSTLPAGTVDDLSNLVLGADLTYGWRAEAQSRSWTTGGELLFFLGDVGAEIDDNALVGDPSDDTVRVIDEDVHGFYAFLDHAWTATSSAGAQWSWLELPLLGQPELSEVELYYTRNLSAFQRLRFLVSHTDSDVEADSLRFAIQWTGFIGPHSHSVRW